MLRERFSIQDWNLFFINCLLVPATNNGNESANGRFSKDFGAHPPFCTFSMILAEELERVTVDIPSILYASLKPKESPLYDSLKYDREVVKANYEVGLIDLDGYMGKIGSLSLNTGKYKYNADHDEKPKKKKAVPPSLNNPISSKAGSKEVTAPTGRRGRPVSKVIKPASSSIPLQALRLSPHL